MPAATIAKSCVHELGGSDAFVSHLKVFSITVGFAPGIVYPSADAKLLVAFERTPNCVALTF